MKNKNFIFGKLFLFTITIVMLLFISCEKNLEVKEKDKNEGQEFSEILVENGYLNFASQESLDTYMSNVSEELGNSVNNQNDLKSLRVVNIPQGFCPLASKIKAVDSKLKSGTPCESDSNSNLEQFYNELDKTIIPEEVLHYVLDTAKRVKVAGEIYKITEVGTFVYTDNTIEEFENLYADFLNTYKNYGQKLDSVTYIYGSIKFIDSYNFVKNDNLSLEGIIAMANDGEISENGATKSVSERIVPEYTNTYKLTNYRVGGSTAVGRFFAGIGLNNWRSKEFDSDHRVNVNLYELNYGFFKCAGFKCKFQYKHHVKITVGFGHWKKTITLLSYWLETSVPEMVIGIDFFKGYTQFTDFGLIPSSYQDELKKNSKVWANVAANMVFKGYLKEPEALVKNWVSNLHVFGGAVEVLENSYTDTDAYKKLYDEGYNWLTDEFKKRASGFVYEKTNRNSKTPIMILSPGIRENSNKEYLMLNGVSSYSNKSEQTIRFGQPSFGITLTFGGSNNWNPRASAFTPNAFNIQEAYVFGAVKYNGEWKGVRMYIP